MELATIAWLSIGLAALCALVIALDEVRYPQAMAVMNVVWPVTALYFSVFALWAYFAIGRKKARGKQPMSQRRDMGHPEHGRDQRDEMGSDKDAPPTLAQIGVSTTHCAAGCMIADVICEFGIAALGITLLGTMLWAGFVIDYVAAWTLGIVFQYGAIKPMRHDLSVGGALIAAIKADTLSITAFQVGMYAWMALVYFKLFAAPHLTAFDPRYWLMMQIAMICGFATSFPINRLLIGIGLKEKM